MFYSILFFIFYSSVCIDSAQEKIYEKFPDRLDLLIKDSYLIIECNQNEYQIIHFVNTYEELQSNLNCGNKDKILEHGKERTQIIDFFRVILKCKNNKKDIDLNGEFQRIKQSLDIENNNVEWPFLRTSFLNEKDSKEPRKMKFLKKQLQNFDLIQTNVEKLPEGQQPLFIYLDFINRPMVCRVRLTGLRHQAKGSCDMNNVHNFTVYEPVCLYKVSFILKIFFYKFFIKLFNKFRQYSISAKEFELEI